jgi:tRNA 2-selenouridine synthase SelU
MSMDNCEDVMTVCGIYLLAEDEKRVERKYWIYKQAKRKENFTLCFVRLKDGRQHLFFKNFRMSISKFENLKQLLHTDTEKKNTQWGRSTTEERLALALKSLHRNV